jgi:hypothetical protein
LDFHGFSGNFLSPGLPAEAHRAQAGTFRLVLRFPRRRNSAMTHKQHSRPENRPDHTGEKHKPTRVVATWPDQKARQEMSKSEVARNSRGKHSKNPDWERAW